MSTRIFYITVDPRDDFDTALAIAISDATQEVAALFERGKCDDCNTTYDLGDTEDHCAECGTCWEHCAFPMHDPRKAAAAEKAKHGTMARCLTRHQGSVTTCGTCGGQWCDLCDPVSVSAGCHYCTGRGWSKATITLPWR
jgi:hypothetical protein